MSPLSKIQLHHEDGKTTEVISVTSNGKLLRTYVWHEAWKLFAAKGDISRREFILMHSED